MIVIMILWVLYSIAEGYEDSQYRAITDHKATVYPRLANGLLVVWLHMGYPFTIYHIWFGFILAFSFWFVFELARNYFVGSEDLIYIGNESVIDKITRRHKLAMFFLRFWLTCLAFCLYYWRELSIYANG